MKLSNPLLHVFALALALGLVLGLGLGSTAVADSGSDWRCFAVDQLGDLKTAGGHKAGKQIAKGLNEVATRAPAGTTLTFNYPLVTGKQLLCVKE